MKITNYPQYIDLKSKVVLITGGGSGIGASFVKAFAIQGSQVAFVDINKKSSEKLVNEISSKHTKPKFINCNLEDIDNFVKEIGKVEDELGPIRVLINNAANDQRHEPKDVTPEYWEERFRLNLNHYFFAAQTVRKKMADAGGGAIINMGSISWHMAMDFMPGYTTSKAAIEGLTQSLARAYGNDLIRVNCIVPGQIWTAKQMNEHLSPEYEKFMMDKQCLPEKILPEDVAQLALFLASDAGRMCTRRNFFIDAGIGA